MEPLRLERPILRRGRCSWRSFATSLVLVVSIAAQIVAETASEEPFRPTTRIAIKDGFWELNGKPTFPGTLAEGLLPNVRMVNATFDDRNTATRPKDFSADANTASFIDAIPRYVESGVVAFTLNLQGGSPGYEGALNSALESDGSLRAPDLDRIRRVIEACDRAGAVVILGCLYQAQDQVLADENAVKRAIVDTAKWIQRRGYTNVVLEIANEHEHDGYQHKIIRDPEGCAELIRLAKETHPKLLVSSSGMGDGRLAHQVISASDFLLIHFNGTPIARFDNNISAASKSSKAIVCNEDDKTGAKGAEALELCARTLCSWGYMNKEKNQYYPFSFLGPEDDLVVYSKLREITSVKLP
jgi:hypothetical protein